MTLFAWEKHAMDQMQVYYNKITLKNGNKNFKQQIVWKTLLGLKNWIVKVWIVLRPWFSEKLGQIFITDKLYLRFPCNEKTIKISRGNLLFLLKREVMKNDLEKPVPM